MQNIIIAAIIIVLIFTIASKLLGAILYALLYALFDPRVNSIIYLIFFLLVGIGAWQEFGSDSFLVLLILIGPIIFDCILDIKRSYNYYSGPTDIRIDKLYLIKSLTAIPTFGFSRIVFRFIVGPCLSLSVLLDIHKKIAAGQPFQGIRSKLQAKHYYYGKHIRKMVQKGTVVYNGDTIKIETEVISERLRDLYPKNLIEKLVEKLSEDSTAEDKRKELEQKLSDGYRSYAYLNAAVFAQYAQSISEVMRTKGPYSPSDIQNFEELSALNLTVPIGGSTDWSEYFIIQALQPLVADGTFKDNDFSDGVDSHVYEHTGSAKAMKSISAENDSRFALDDDEDI